MAARPNGHSIMSEQHTDYASLLRQRGFRMTPQREIILDAIGQGHGHTDFDEIFARVQARSPAMNRATLYRTLEFLSQQRLIFPPRSAGTPSMKSPRTTRITTWCASTAAPPRSCRTRK